MSRRHSAAAGLGRGYPPSSSQAHHPNPVLSASTRAKHRPSLPTSIPTPVPSTPNPTSGVSRPGPNHGHGANIASRMKKKAYHVLSLKPPEPTSSGGLQPPTEEYASRVRAASMPDPAHHVNDWPTQAQIDIEHDRLARALRLRASSASVNTNKHNL